MAPSGRRKRVSEHSNRSRLSGVSSLASGLSQESNAELPPFFNTTFSTHRVSPLYIGPEPLSRQRLATLSKSLRDLLVGDVVRGVEVGLDGEDNIMARAGALDGIDMGWETVGTILGMDPDSLDRDVVDAAAAGDASVTDRRLKAASTQKAFHISLRYERAFCLALLLPRLDEDGDEDEKVVAQNGNALLSTPEDAQPSDKHHFRTLPLLLLRMPAPLKTVIFDFLSNNFDCRISPLRLGTKTLVSNLERWVGVADQLTSASASKDVVLTLGFDIPPAKTTGTDGMQTTTTVDLGLKSLDVMISATDLQDFRSRGQKPLKRKGTWFTNPQNGKRRKGIGHLLEEGWEWRERDKADGSRVTHPFTEALGAYFDEHFALNLFDPRTRITKVACGGFAMSEGRLKLFPPPGDDGERRATTEHMRAVVDCLGDLSGKGLVAL